jgi:cytochrome d ubiquinol oxidase subunit I
VLAGISGSFLVITVNGWMNSPTGFRLVNGHVTDVHPWKALFNDNFWHEFVHMYFAGFMVAGFLVAGAYALARLRGERTAYHRAGLLIPLTVAALAAPAQVVIGDWAGRSVAAHQPTKLAAFEGVGHTEKGAAIHVGGYYTGGRVKYGVPIPKGLSILAKHDPNATIQGLDAVPAADRPPVNVVRYAFQTMVGIGTLLALLGVVYLVTWWRHRRLPRSRLFLWAVVAAGPLATVALIAGWVTTEVGRQPWTVYHVMTTAQSVTGAGGIPVGYAALVITYLAVAAALVWILRRLARAPLHLPGADAPPDATTQPA